MTSMASFLLGAIAMACLAVGLVFLRFARKTGERLFLYFTAFFWIEAVDRTLQGLGGLTDDDLSVYVMRAFAFAVIIAGVVDKNLPRDRGR